MRRGVGVVIGKGAFEVLGAHRPWQASGLLLQAQFFEYQANAHTNCSCDVLHSARPSGALERQEAPRVAAREAFG